MTDEQREAARRMAAAGVYVSEVARRLGVARSTLSTWGRREGLWADARRSVSVKARMTALANGTATPEARPVPVKASRQVKATKPPKPGSTAARLADLAPTHTAREAAAVVGLSRSGVEMCALRYGFRFDQLTERRVRQVRACAEVGMSPRAAAERVGIELTGIYRIARREGFRFVTHAERIAARRAAEAAAAAEAKAREDAELMARWRVAAAARKAERAAEKAAARLPVVAPSRPRLTAADEAFARALGRAAE